MTDTNPTTSPPPAPAPIEHTRPQLSPNVSLLAACLLTFVGVGVDIYLRSINADASAAVLFILGPAAGLFAKAGVDASTLGLDKRLDRQDQALAVITHQTNGVLDAKIKNGIESALSARDAQIGQTVAAIQAAAQPGVIPAPVSPPTDPAPPGP